MAKPKYKLTKFREKVANPLQQATPWFLANSINIMNWEYIYSMIVHYTF